MNTKSYFTIIALCGTILAFGGGVRASDSSSVSDSGSVGSRSSEDEPATIWDELGDREKTTELTSDEIKTYVTALKNEPFSDSTKIHWLLSACGLPLNLATASSKHGNERVEIIEKIIAIIENVITPILEAFIKAGGTMEHSSVNQWINTYLATYHHSIVKGWKKVDNKNELSELEQSFVKSIEDLITLLKALILVSPERRWYQRRKATFLLVRLSDKAGT